ncbi:MAG: signal peptidase I [Clostridiales bacterium]|nr:signal peptidase I [Clostridiales bacterium]
MYKAYDSLIEKARRKEKSNRAFSLFFGVVILLVVTIYIFTNYILISVYVDGESMSPTLSDGNVLFANKNMVAEAGDIIVIDGEKESQDGKGYDWLIKRAIVVGQKGKTLYVKIEAGKVWVGENEQEFEILEETYLPEQTITTYVGTNPYWEVKEGEIFYLGDNRENSKDSRYSAYGTCKTSQVVGVVPDWALSMREFSRFIFDVGQFLSSLF